MFHLMMEGNNNYSKVGKIFMIIGRDIVNLGNIDGEVLEIITGKVGYISF